MINYSQNNEQDTILTYLNYYDITSGTLLDIGAYDGETYSNTRAIMIKYPKWKGIFVEPSSHSFVKLFNVYQNEPRRAELINLLVTTEDELNNEVLVEFYDTPTQSPASSIDIKCVNRFVNKVDNFGASIDPRKVITAKVGLKQLFLKFKNTPFEFINVDIEGGSAKLVLQDWFNPLDYGCKLICIEHDNMISDLQNKFNNLGYKTISYTGENLIFGL